MKSSFITNSQTEYKDMRLLLLLLLSENLGIFSVCQTCRKLQQNRTKQTFFYAFIKPLNLNSIQLKSL